MSKIVKINTLNINQEGNLKFLGFPRNFNFSSISYTFLLLSIVLISNYSNVFAQDFSQPYNYQNTNYMSNSTAFKQEIARLDINVMRQGKGQMPIAQVPRLQKDDVLKVRLLDEPVNGIKPDQSNWQWTLLIAYVNPGLNGDSEKSVSEEIQFKKTGWYKEYSFVVPYDNQPIFFLYPKPNYREKILNLINKNKDEIRKIGEKTIEIANAYAKVGSFLNELQYVLNRSAYGYYGYTGTTYTNTNTNTYNTTDGGYYDPNYSTTTTTAKPSFNKTLFLEQSIERLARSFNIQMPNCWMNGSYYGGYNSSGYNSGYNNGYNSSYNSGAYSGYGSGYYGTMLGNDLVSRTQCLAKSVRLEDLDFSIGKMLQQGGILLAQQLSQQYPQIAHWINIAAVAIDFILKVTQKTPLKLVPTVITSSLGQNSVAANPAPYSNSFTSTGASYQVNPTDSQPGEQAKISLFAEASPMDNGFVTAYPIVVHKWQANPDPEVIRLPVPVLTDNCMHVGSNILASTDVMNDWMADPFTKDFQLIINSANGLRKVMPLKKNVGFNGWELMLTKEDLESFPKINMPLTAVVTGKRGFNEISSAMFRLPSPAGGTWEITPESQNLFAVGARRTVTIRNNMNSCKCLQAVIYKPSFGGQFVYEANNNENGLRFSDDGKEVSFDVDATTFQSGDGQLELRQFGGEVSVMNLKLHPVLPFVSEFKVAKGDKKFLINGEGLEQVRALIINGERAVLINSTAKKAKNTDEKEFGFENPDSLILSNKVSLELELQDNRIYQYPKKFEVSLARPTLDTNETKEVAGKVVNNSKGVYKNIAPEKPQNSNPVSPKAKSAPVSDKLPDFPAGGSEVTMIVKNALTDYDFKAENIQIETRIEDFPNQSFEVLLPKANFQVLDWKQIQVSFLITKPFKDILGEGKLQFRIRDKERGDSDWYTVRNNATKEDEPSLTHFEKSNLKTEERQISSPTNSTQTANSAGQIPVSLENQTLARNYTATGLDFYGKKDYKAAFEWFNKAVAADPGNALYRYNLGSVLTALMDFRAAEKEMSEAAKLDPENQTYKIGLEVARLNSKNFPGQN